MAGHDASPLVIVPINSANWSQVALDERPELQALINAGFEKLGDPTSAKNQRLRKLIESLLVHDIARVSTTQRDAISVLFKRTKKFDKISLDDNTIRMVVMHHHLLPIGATEEVKTFESMINLGALRQFLATEGVNIVVHGHKHTEAMYADHVELPKNKANSEILVISGGSYKSEPDENISQDRVPYIHGVRLYRYNGFLDQMRRITNLLDTHSGRISGASGSSMADAIAVLLDPLQDFEDVEVRTKRGYLAFCLLQFVHRKGYLDGQRLLQSAGV
jgi:hypothetical protein